MERTNEIPKMASLALENQNVLGMSLTPREILIYAGFPLTIWPLHHDCGIIVMHENGPDSLGDMPLLYRNFLIMVC